MIGVWGLYRENLHVIFDMLNKFFKGGFASDGNFDPCVVHGIVTLVQFSVLCFGMKYDFNARQIGVYGEAVPQVFVIHLVDMVLNDLFDCSVDSVSFHEFSDILFLRAVD